MNRKEMLYQIRVKQNKVSDNAAKMLVICSVRWVKTAKAEKAATNPDREIWDSLCRDSVRSLRSRWGLNGKTGKMDRWVKTVRAEKTERKEITEKEQARMTLQTDRNSKCKIKS